MKRILYILMPVLLLSCENMLDEVPKNFVSRSNYYQNEAEAQGAINGAYAAIGPDFFGITYYLLIELHGDFLNGRGSQVPISLVDRVLDQQNIGRANTAWASIYTAINRANAVLDNIPGIANMNEEVKTRIVAEAHFLRALCYFELVRGWGAVPLRTVESKDLSELGMARASEEEVYSLIVSDLQVAEQGLPLSVGTEKGKASVWAAKMLLAHVYLTTGEYAAAAEKADDVITSGNFSLVEVQSSDDFYDIFAAETSPEEIMSVKHSPNRLSDLPLYLHMAGNRPYNYATSGFFAWLPDRNSFLGVSWDDNDLRKNFNLYTQYQNSSGQWVMLPNTAPVLFKKYITTSDALRIHAAPIYRYAEALLFYAEAAARAEGAPSALALERLNMVKRRAYGYDPEVASPVDYPAGMSADAFVDAVLQERSYEFMLERRRFFDLKRTGNVKEAFAAVGKTFVDERMLFPIPESEINNNPSLSQADQNPGY